MLPLRIPPGGVDLIGRQIEFPLMRFGVFPGALR